jgi:hypothetical protein
LTDESCYYTFKASDQTTYEGLEKYNRKWLQIYFDMFNGLDIYVSNSTSKSNIVNSHKVTTSNRNFTIAPTSSLFVTVKPTNNTRYG